MTVFAALVRGRAGANVSVVDDGWVGEWAEIVYREGYDRGEEVRAE